MSRQIEFFNPCLKLYISTVNVCLAEAQLLELHDYMVHKDITMERIKELEDKLAEERISYETQIKKLQDKVESERNK